MTLERIGWGVDLQGYRHFICDKCDARLGKSKTAQNFEIIHTCGVVGDAAWDDEPIVMGRDELLKHLTSKM